MFPQLRRCQIDGQPSTGKCQPAVADRGSDALASFLNGRSGQAYKHERSFSPTVVRLHLNASRLETDKNT
jgi:hypothetical protein